MKAIIHANIYKKDEDALLIDDGIIQEIDSSENILKKITNEDELIDLKGAFLLPGFIDSHIHIESTMLTPAQFAKLAVRFGTTSVVCDPHEIANVAGTVRIERVNLLKTFFADVYTMIPFRNTLFGLQVKNLSDIFNEFNNVAGQIMPLIGESYHYFGAFFAPVLSMFFAQGTIWANKKMYLSKHIFSFGTYTMFRLYFSSMLVCKNLILFGSTFTSTLLPMIIMCKFVGDKYDFTNLRSIKEENLN